MSEIDWRFLRKPLIYFVVGVLVAAGSGAAGYYYEMGRVDAYNQSISQLRDTHRKYRAMVDDLDLMEQFRAKYSDYKATGLVGDERRLSWIESLQSTNQVLKLPALSYSLLPQEDFKRPGFKVKRNVDVKSSPMELSMDILHEEDVFALLEGLRLSIKNLFTVDSCRLIRTSGVEASWSTRSPNMRSVCVLRWVTVNAK